MAGSSLLALIDDIATILDDVALMTKVASKKTAGVLGDDLALNAQQVAGVRADRELPVVWAVAKGSARNKVILVPIAILLSAFFPWLITPLLMLGGLFLCYEGFEKIAHKWLDVEGERQARHAERVEVLKDEQIDMVAYEQQKIKGAVRTDFILSGEIIVIALGTVQDALLITQIAVVTTVAAIMTVGVYALVAGIVKLDDAGLALSKQLAAHLWARFQRAAGHAILWLAPRLMKTLSVVGTIAMFMVGGGILLHGLPHSHEILGAMEEWVHVVPLVGSVFSLATVSVANILAGLIVGALALGLITLFTKAASLFKSAK